MMLFVGAASIGGRTHEEAGALSASAADKHLPSGSRPVGHGNIIPGALPVPGRQIGTRELAVVPRDVGPAHVAITHNDVCSRPLPVSNVDHGA
eukprot:CAMPEP_0173434200 /NCGR_PEP_ID=MMETSP1357-20121228/12233_1 /TAXON_ID=77926 /ORGANISM="Hemiselmis rufescens, Strain PCC563" /LENGTH=92 /DNA_ID=CAMNT_0014399013 /DNA_START=185 /DNA_END=464 /DNA_ORIENTATION=+